MIKLFLTTAITLTFVLGCKFGSADSEASRNNSAPPSDTLNSAAIDPANSETNLATPAATPQTQKTNAVCPDPVRPCNHKDKTFDPWEISFKMPAKLASNKSYESTKFYAVILKTYESEDDCDGGEFVEAIEAERKTEQKNHPSRKVFASYECPNMAAVSYDFDGRFDAKRERILIGNFLAVYAGPTKEEADNLLNDLKAKYPKATAKQMTASYEVMDQ